MNIVNVTGNILDVLGEKYIAHSISRDYTLGAGLAKQLNEKFNLSYTLFRDFDEAYVGDAILVGTVFNLIVKETYKEKVDDDNLYNALCDLKGQLLDLGIKEIAMPRICCGREKMNWQEVKNMLHDVFIDTGITIFVYDLPHKEKEDTLNNKIKNNRKVDLFDGLLEFAVSMIPDRDDVYDILINLGFTKEEIEAEGFKQGKHICTCGNDCGCGGGCGDNCKCHAPTEDANGISVFDASM